MDCYTCDGNGEWTCPECGNATALESGDRPPASCPQCGGIGYVICPTCGGTGYWNSASKTEGRM